MPPPAQERKTPSTFHGATQRWFSSTFEAPTEIQSRGWPCIARGDHTLLIAPTGSGKTLAAFLCGIDRVLHADPLSSPMALVTRASPYATLSPAVLTSVLEMLSGHYPSDDFADLRPRLTWDRSNDTLGPRKGTRMMSILNAGTIPDRGLYSVHLGPDGPRVGELDEEMVFESRPGDTFILGASTWRVEEVTRDRVIVSPAPGQPGRMPFWHGDGPGRPIELGRALGEFTRQLGAKKGRGLRDHIKKHTVLDTLACENLASYIERQKEHTKTLPTDRAITIERFRDELGDWRVCILSPFGSRVHAPWALALQSQLTSSSGFEVQTMYTDDGIVLRMADAEDVPDLDALIPDPETLEELVTERLGESALFAGLFRENAARALLLPRNRPGKRNPLWSQRIKAKNLLAVVKRFPAFPMVLETYRQCLKDVFDVPALRELLLDIRSRKVRVDIVETPSPSPFAKSLVFAYVAAYLYEQDAPLAERRAQALTLDRGLLRELMGDDDLRQLLDSEVIEAVELEAQGLAPGWQARNADEVHDMLRRLGDLSLDDIQARCENKGNTVELSTWLDRLRKERRVVAVSIGGSQRLITAEDAGRYRDGLGAIPPAGLPEAFIGSRPDALVSLVKRWSQSRGPFFVRDLAAQWKVATGQLLPLVERLAMEGVLVKGITVTQGQPDWCEAGMLAKIKRRTLAALRKKIAPVEPRRLGSFLPQWHSLDRPRRGPDALATAVMQLEGLAVPWASLESEWLTPRVADYRPETLDLWCAQGSLVWVGSESTGPKGGRIRLFRRSQAALLLEHETDPTPAFGSPVHEAIYSHLQLKGASFLSSLKQAVAVIDGITTASFETAVWDLVWRGLITNDTFQPLRQLNRKPKSLRRQRAVGMAGGRWSLVRDLVDPLVSDTERMHAQCMMLLERYGIVTREAVSHEGIVGGFSRLYRVFRAMEEAGKIRRGYFIEGLGGAQFGLAGAVDRLRQGAGNAPLTQSGPHKTHTSDDYRGSTSNFRWLSSTDPANPWGALIRWPQGPGQSQSILRRVPKAMVGLIDGDLRIYLSGNRRQLVIFDLDLERRQETVDLLKNFGVLAADARSRSLRLTSVNGETNLGGEVREILLASGFSRDPKHWYIEAQPR